METLNMSQKLPIKVTIVPINETRRFSLAEPSLQSVKLSLINILKIDDISQFDTKYTITYEDNDKEIVTIEFEEEFLEAVKLSQDNNRILRIMVNEKVKPQVIPSKEFDLLNNLQPEVIQSIESCIQNLQPAF